jgi:hypothetical protein
VLFLSEKDFIDMKHNLYALPSKLLLVGICWLSMPLLGQSCLRPGREVPPEPESTPSYVSETDSVVSLEHAHSLPMEPVSDIRLSAAESGSLMHYLGRYSEYISRGLGTVMPVFDALMLADWASDISKTLRNPHHDAYDDWAAALYLIPGVAGVAQLAAKRHHLHQTLQARLKDLHQRQRYQNLDNNQRSMLFRVQINTSLQALEQMRNHHQVDQRLYLLQQTQQAHTAWQQHLHTWVQQQISQLIEPYRVHIHAQLYRAPYGLAQQLNWREYPGACDPRVLQYDLAPEWYPEVRQQLRTCLGTINRQMFQPILKVIQDQHPHLNLSTWQQLHPHYQEGHAAILTAATRAEKNWWQNWQARLEQHQVQQPWSEHWQATIAPVVQRIQHLVMLHWLANTFPDLPLAVINVNVEQKKFYLLNEAWCSPQFHQSRWFRIYGVASACQMMNRLTSWIAPADVITFEPQKSDLWQQLERLTPEPQPWLTVGQAQLNGASSMQWYLKHYHQMEQQLSHDCRLMQRVLPEAQLHCSQLLQMSSLTKSQQDMLSYNLNTLYAYHTLKSWHQQAPQLSAWMRQLRDQPLPPSLPAAVRNAIQPELAPLFSLSKPELNLVPPPSGTQSSWQTLQPHLNRLLRNPTASINHPSFTQHTWLGWSRLWRHYQQIRQRYQRAMAQLSLEDDAS